MEVSRRLNGPGMARLLGVWRTRGENNLTTALAEHTRLLILDGRLPIQIRLPGERELAEALALSRTTVAAAYNRLREQGFLTSRQGSGSWVTLPNDSATVTPAPWAPSATAHPAELDLAQAALAAPPGYMHEAIAYATAQLPQYLHGAGYQLLGTAILRQAVAARFNARGLPTTEDQILITAGAQHALSIVLATLTQPGSRVLVEHPTYPNALDAIRQRGARPVPVGFVDGRWDIEMLSHAARDAAPQLAYLIPDFQNPTGMLMREEERAAIVDIARRTGTPFVVDETLTDLAIDGPRPRPLACHDRDEESRIITLGSASKILWGGFRIGWIRAAAPMIRRLAASRAVMDMSSPIMDQLMVAHLLPKLDTIAEERRAILGRSRDALIERLAIYLPEWRPATATGGVSLWIDLGMALSSRLASEARQHNILLTPGPRFGIDGAFERFLRIPFTVPPEQAAAAAQRLSMAWLKLRSERRQVFAPELVS